MHIPPIFFCAIGAVMAVFGATRALVLGRRREDRTLVEDTPAAARVRRNHIVFGTLHIIMGIFLILLTTGVIPSRLGH